jgi:hypothetical protein
VNSKRITGAENSAPVSAYPAKQISNDQTNQTQNDILKRISSIFHPDHTLNDRLLYDFLNLYDSVLVFYQIYYYGGRGRGGR